MVLQFGPHQLRKMGSSPYLRHGQSKHNQPRSCHGVHEWQFHFSQNQQSVLLHGCGPAHEQNNAAVKSDGGVVGLTRSPEALTRWMVAGPEMVRMTSEFEASLERKHNKPLDTSHYDQVFPDDFWKTDQIPG